MAAGAALGLVEQAGSGLLEFRDAPGEVRHAKGDVVDAFAAFRQKFSDYGVLFGRLEKFDPRASDGQHCDIHLFMGDGFARGHSEAELLLIKLERLIKRAHCDTEMVDANLL
jgi:hypothetical protein